ncbi:unnamed protein product [Paramecium sonneborni]|uniref:Uncharacterized protein n=1 Tax=Paramecium sonneborni TaxID=65129 RepID=A0A8S1K0A8_9CILI|nr:unnamed protein product [Paramecium sonneborni]
MTNKLKILDAQFDDEEKFLLNFFFYIQIFVFQKLQFQKLLFLNLRALLCLIQNNYFIYQISNLIIQLLDQKEITSFILQKKLPLDLYLKRLSTDLENLNQQFNDKFNQQKIVLAQKEQLLIDIPITEELLQLTKEQQEQYHQAYISRQTQRLSEIEVVQKAYNLVFDHVDSVKKSEDLTAKLSS